MKQLDVRIIIVGWSTWDILRNCPQSTHEQRVERDLGAIIADSRSSYESAKRVNNEFPQVYLVHNLSNRMFATATNHRFPKPRANFDSKSHIKLSE